MNSIIIEIRNIRDMYKIWQRQLTTLPLSYSSSPLFYLFFLHLPFSTKCRSEAARYFHITNSSWRTIRRGRTIDNANGRSARWPISIEITKGVRYPFVVFTAPRKRSMSLLAGSWRSTEPSTLKRKLNEISNRQELPRIGPIKPPPVPRTYTRVY